MAYGRKSRKKSRAPRPSGRTAATGGLPRIAKPRRPRIPKSTKNQLALRKVVRVVAKMQKQAYGNLQLQRQILVPIPGGVHPGGSDRFFTLCAEQPICWLMQAITDDAKIYGLEYTNTASPFTYHVSGNGVARWEHQLFSPAVLGDPLLTERYDTQQFWSNQDGGTNAPKVSPNFMLGTSSYNINLTALGVQGYVELLCVTYTGPNRSRAPLLETQFPSGLVSFVETARLSYAENVVSNKLYRCKLMKRHYFCNLGVEGSPANHPNTEHFKAQTHQTYLHHNWRVRVKHNSLIEVSAPAEGSDPVYSYEDIPLNKQVWMMIRTSVPAADLQGVFQPTPPVVPPLPPTAIGFQPFKRLIVEAQRTISFRDQTGSST